MKREGKKGVEGNEVERNRNQLVVVLLVGQRRNERIKTSVHFVYFDIYTSSTDDRRKRKGKRERTKLEERERESRDRLNPGERRSKTGFHSRNEKQGMIKISKSVLIFLPSLFVILTFFPLLFPCLYIIIPQPLFMIRIQN